MCIVDYYFKLINCRCKKTKTRNLRLNLSVSTCTVSHTRALAKVTVYIANTKLVLSNFLF